MLKGFFAKSELTKAKAPSSMIAKCGACGLYRTCRSPKMDVFGKGEKEILIIAETPGKEEDARGKPLIGESGKMLESTLKSFGVDMRKDCWLYHSVICQPPKGETPTTEQIDYCRPNLLNVLRKKKPKVIIPLGLSAMTSVFGHTWKGQIGAATRWIGWKIPDTTLNAWICPTYHPSFLLRSMRGEFGRTGNPVLSRLFEKHLEEAVELEDRPFTKPPQHAASIERIFDTEEASRRIDRFTEDGGPIAFDYETNCLRPETKGAAIYSAAICWRGKETIAFPFDSNTKRAMITLLRSNCPKIGSNIKYEERWTHKMMECNVRRWVWDTVLAAHCIDNRPHITSLKFQAYVLLGVPPYDDHIKPFLESSNGANGLNSIDRIDWNDLLMYNGMDALMSYKVAMIQKGWFDHGSLNGMDQVT